MKLSNLCDEDLMEVANMKTRKGIATSEARRAQQILYSRNITHGGFFNSGTKYYGSSLDNNCTRDYKSFEELNGYSLKEE